VAFDASDERLSKYELIRPLGSGGMGEVYLARDRVLDRRVALKFVSSARLEEKEAGRRLVREARAAAALDHPAICPVYDVFESEGRPCIVMQYVDGETLAARLARGSLPPDEAVTLALRIAEALAAAHAAGIIHRDLKPQNIVLTADGRPKLLDFGIAQMQLPPEVAASVVTHTATVSTNPGAIVGTPAYTSPEQVLRKPVDGRSDLFSLGAVLFECLTGQPAFLAGTDVDTWARVVYTAPPAPSSINRSVPQAVDAVVAKLLAKDPAERYASAGEAAAALRALGGRGTYDGMSRRQLVLVAAAVVVAIALTGFTAWRLTRPRPLPPAPPEAASWYEIGTQQLRDGAFASAERALKETLRLYPDYPLAWARLAEAQTALDEERDASSSVVRIASIVPDTSRVSGVDGIRLAAVRALVLPDLSMAIQAYQRIANQTPNDRGAWLDLARVDQLADRRSDALAAAERSLRIDPQYAAGHLWRAVILGDLRRGDEALKEFAEAERLYGAASNVEGQTETLYRRASFLNAGGDVRQARSIADTAARLAAQSGSTFQQINVSLLQSNIAVGAGDFDTARRLATDAIDNARRNQLDTVTASGLIDLGTVLMYSGDIRGSEAKLKDSIVLAQRLDAKRIWVRGALQLASLYTKTRQPRDAVALANGILNYIRWAQYKYYELMALGILSRAKGMLNEHDEAARLANELLSLANSLHDDDAVAVALQNLANEANARGALPADLGFLVRQEKIHRDQQQNQSLAFDLVNHAEVLLLLGRFDEAEAPLKEIDAGISAHIGAFVGRARTMTLLRAVEAAAQEQFTRVDDYADQILSNTSKPDSASRLAAVLLANAHARLRRPDSTPIEGPPVSDTHASPDLRYWSGIALLARGDGRAAGDQADALLASLKDNPNVETEWRAAALGAAAARARKDTAAADALVFRARHALDSLRNEWRADAVDYEKRPDLMSLKRAAGMI
jgi:tetratricopeptide (TPR) repeat protein/tRNA A-37 threonylcarbamoyl transferase component Bud32